MRSSKPLVLHTVIGFISAYFPCIVTDLAKSAQHGITQCPCSPLINWNEVPWNHKYNFGLMVILMVVGHHMDLELVSANY